MAKFKIEGGTQLDGSLKVKGAKNSVLPLLAGSILTEKKVVLHNCPNITDVNNMIKILECLGCSVKKEEDTITIDSSNILHGEIPSDLAHELRSSIFLLGSILTRIKKAKVAYPGGCDIGMRPIDIHLKGLKELNISVIEEGGYIYCDSSNAKSADIFLEKPSVGATENLMMAAICLKGTTLLRNPAKEPEIVDLQEFLNKMGAKIKGAGGSVIAIEGVQKLNGVEHTPISDRIVVGTYMLAGAMCGCNLQICNAIPEHNHSLIAKLSKTACNIYNKNDIIYIQAKERLKSIDYIETMYYPGFPTDLQAQMMALQTVADGTSVIVENIFETRYKQVPEFMKIGANIMVKDRTCIVQGVQNLKGAEVKAFDLRGGASLVMCGLVARGITTVDDVFHIDRGYEALEIQLQDVGAKIERIKD
ncbi:MAG: UDP-N-acetylglucosamine 1-carboxyvinyltransferase [Clostridia bacterium]